MLNNPTSTPRFILDITQLQPADIFLIHGDGKMSPVIELVTKSIFSHASLYLGLGSFIEATPRGVHTENIQRLLVKNRDHLKVLRLKKPATSESLYEICNSARREYGKEYSYFGAYTSVTDSNFFEESKQFCSQLVATCYYKSGYDLCDNISKCIPESINCSNLLYEVTNVLKLATQQEIEFAKDESNNKTKMQSEIVNKLLNGFRTISNSNIPTFKDAMNFIVNNPEYDDKFTSLLYSSGYIDFYKIDIEKCPWRYTKSALYEFCKNKNFDAKKFAMTQVVISNNIIIRYDKELSVWTTLTKRHPNLSYAKAHRDLYQKLTTLFKDSKKMLENVINNSSNNTDVK